jgi:exosortase/archaeosortase
MAAAIYFVLMAAYGPAGPWPGLGRIHAHVLAALAQVAFAGSDQEHSIHLSVVTPPPEDGRDLLLVASGRWRSSASSMLAGYGPMALAIALVIATPATWRRRIVGVALALAILHALMLLRLGAQFWFAVHGPGSPEHAAATHAVPAWQQHVGVLIYSASVAYGAAVLAWMAVMAPGVRGLLVPLAAGPRGPGPAVAGAGPAR